MIRLSKALNAWGSPSFEAVVKQEIEQLDPQDLPLQRGLTLSSHVADRPVQAMLLNVTDEAERIGIKIGVFYTGVIAGCSCANDPTPIDEQNEYCVIQLGIDKTTADATIRLLTD